eukprot:TRINITY_DN1852_c0_g1_i1.p1 TRINITY_DN1852_c0_g1~~TRINITY_DN1852_c0_g1_i1.p1  ORF type:complete len:1418 (+),score=416.54 TRINITY_DN1852_c0_g1_i1:64-4317(+)
MVSKKLNRIRPNRRKGPLKRGPETSPTKSTVSTKTQDISDHPHFFLPKDYEIQTTDVIVGILSEIFPDEKNDSSKRILIIQQSTKNCCRLLYLDPKSSSNVDMTDKKDNSEVENFEEIFDPSILFLSKCIIDFRVVELDLIVESPIPWNNVNSNFFLNFQRPSNETNFFSLFSGDIIGNNFMLRLFTIDDRYLFQKLLTEGYSMNNEFFSILLKKYFWIQAEKELDFDETLENLLSKPDMTFEDFPYFLSPLVKEDLQIPANIFLKTLGKDNSVPQQLRESLGVHQGMVLYGPEHSQKYSNNLIDALANKYDAEVLRLDKKFFSDENDEHPVVEEGRHRYEDGFTELSYRNACVSMNKKFVQLAKRYKMDDAISFNESGYRLPTLTPAVDVVRSKLKNRTKAVENKTSRTFNIILADSPFIGNGKSPFSDGEEMGDDENGDDNENQFSPNMSPDLSPGLSPFSAANPAPFMEYLDKVKNGAKNDSSGENGLPNAFVHKMSPIYRLGDRVIFRSKEAKNFRSPRVMSKPYLQPFKGLRSFSLRNNKNDLFKDNQKVETEISLFTGSPTITDANGLELNEISLYSPQLIGTDFICKSHEMPPVDSVGVVCEVFPDNPFIVGVKWVEEYEDIESHSCCGIFSNKCCSYVPILNLHRPNTTISEYIIEEKLNMLEKYLSHHFEDQSSQPKPLVLHVPDIDDLLVPSLSRSFKKCFDTFEDYPFLYIGSIHSSMHGKLVNDKEPNTPRFGKLDSLGGMGLPFIDFFDDLNILPASSRTAFSSILTVFPRFLHILKPLENNNKELKLWNLRLTRDREEANLKENLESLQKACAQSQITLSYTVDENEVTDYGNLESFYAIVQKNPRLLNLFKIGKIDYSVHKEVLLSSLSKECETGNLIYVDNPRNEIENLEDDDDLSFNDFVLVETAAAKDTRDVISSSLPASFENAKDSSNDAYIVDYKDNQIIIWESSTKTRGILRRRSHGFMDRSPLILLETLEAAYFFHFKLKRETSQYVASTFSDLSMMSYDDFFALFSEADPTQSRKDRLSGFEPSNKFEKSMLAEVKLPGDLGVSFNDIGALEKVKELLIEQLVLPLKKPQLYQQSKLTGMTKGILLFGPPGTGKTFLAKAVATESRATFLSISPSSLMSKWLGDAERFVRALFKVARALAPTVIFVDEVDALLSSRDRSHEHEAMRKMKNEFMSQWDGLNNQSSAPVVILAATNRPFDLDDAVLRRLSRRILVDLPSTENRIQILQVLLGKAANKLPVEEISKLTERFTGSDLNVLCQTAAHIPIQEYIEEETNKTQANEKEPRWKRLLKLVQSSEIENAADELSNDEDNEKKDIELRTLLDRKTDITNEIRRVQSDVKFALRDLCFEDFKKALKKVSSSVSEDSQSIQELRQWNEKFGDDGSRQKHTHSFLYL